MEQTVTVEYENSEERDQLIADYTADGYRLIEDRLHVDGCFLVFDEMPRWKNRWQQAGSAAAKLEVISELLGLVEAQ